MSTETPDFGETILSYSDHNLLHGLGYKLLRKIGEGSFAKIYLSEYKKNKNQEKVEYYACKIIDTQTAPKNFVFRFLPREIDILGRLEHPYMVLTQSIYLRKNLYFIFMTYGTNGDLLQHIAKNGPIIEDQARIWFRQITIAIQYLHELGYVHRDLKCENILISSHNNMKITDFGFARSMTKSSSMLSETFCGSLSYVAPEILQGQPYNPKFADYWSMGAVLYVMLNKALPFNDTNIKRLFEQQKARHWRFRAKIKDKISHEVKKIVKYLLEPEINKRYNIDNILKSQWFAQDSRLLRMSRTEEDALTRARNIKANLKQTSDHNIPPINTTPHLFIYY